MGQGEGARGVGEGWHLKPDGWRQLDMQKGSALANAGAQV